MENKTETETTATAAVFGVVGQPSAVRGGFAASLALLPIQQCRTRETCVPDAASPPMARRLAPGVHRSSTTEDRQPPGRGTPNPGSAAFLFDPSAHPRRVNLEVKPMALDSSWRTLGPLESSRSVRCFRAGPSTRSCSSPSLRRTSSTPSPCAPTAPSAPLPRRRPRAAGAVGCLGRRALRPGRRRAAQAAPRPSAQVRGGCLTSSVEPPGPTPGATSPSTSTRSPVVPQRSKHRALLNAPVSTHQ